MPAKILDGRAVAAEIRADLIGRTTALRQAGIHPRLLIVVAADDPSIDAYISALERSGAKIGIDVVVDRLGNEVTPAEVRERLTRAGSDSKTHGVLLQQPLPAHLPIRAIADSMPVEKDVDGTHPTNQGHLAFGRSPLFVPATPAAVMALLERSSSWPLAGKRAVMIGRSAVVGLPVATLLIAQNATVTVLHRSSLSLQPYTELADVVIVAVGVPGLITGSMISKGATVIDVGTTPVNGEMKGDVDFESAFETAGAITPVPGGVGPVTNMALLRNVIKAAEGTLR